MLPTGWGVSHACFQETFGWAGALRRCSEPSTGSSVAAGTPDLVTLQTLGAPGLQLGSALPTRSALSGAVTTPHGDPR